MPPWNPIQATCHPDRAHKARGLCHKCYDGQYKRKNPKQHSANVRRASMKRLYGLTEQDYDRMFTEQHGVCAICKNPPKSQRRFDVDHNHITGQVRGLLCTSCNRQVGTLENLEWRAQADVYLVAPFPTIGATPNPYLQAHPVAPTQADIVDALKDAGILGATWNDHGFWEYPCGCAQYQDGWERCVTHKTDPNWFTALVHGT